MAIIVLIFPVVQKGFIWAVPTYIKTLKIHLVYVKIVYKFYN